MSISLGANFSSDTIDAKTLGFQRLFMSSPGGSCQGLSEPMHFVIIASPRTGSTRLSGLMHAQDNIVCQGEIFHPETIFLRWPKRDRSAESMAHLMDLRRRDPTNFLHHVLAQNYGAAHVGFKLFPGHNDDVLWNVVDNEMMRKIVLLRSNFLASYSSVALKRQRDTGKASQETPKKVKFDRDKFLAYCHKKSQFYRAVFDRLNQSRQAFHVVHYEHINDPWFFARLIAFIGGDPTTIRMEAGRNKPNPSHIVSRFSNASAVQEFLSSRGLDHWQFESVISLDPLLEGDKGQLVPGDDHHHESVVSGRHETDAGRLVRTEPA